MPFIDRAFCPGLLTRTLWPKVYDYYLAVVTNGINKKKNQKQKTIFVCRFTRSLYTDCGLGVCIGCLIRNAFKVFEVVSLITELQMRVESMCKTAAN